MDPFHRTVTTRAGGVSAPPFDSRNLGFGVPDDPEAVRENRSRLQAELGVSGIAWMRQVHGTAVATVEDEPGAAIPDTDAMVTRTPGLALAVLVADCVPVLVGDVAGTVVGAAHAGRRGAAGGIALRLIEAMGVPPERLDVLLGPAICGACYEVPPPMQAEVEALLPGSACATRDGTTGLDLRAGLAAQLRAAGVRRVSLDPRCTRQDENLFSHRRSALTGRQAGLIWLPGPR